MVLHLWAQSLAEGDEHPYALLWSMVAFSFALVSVRSLLPAYWHLVSTDECPSCPDSTNSIKASKAKMYIMTIDDVCGLFWVL